VWFYHNHTRALREIDAAIAADPTQARYLDIKARILFSLAGWRADASFLEEAKRLVEEAIALRRQHHSEHVSVGQIHFNVAFAYPKFAPDTYKLRTAHYLKAIESGDLSSRSVAFPGISSPGHIPI
jgi:hypothetical protein